MNWACKDNSMLKSIDWKNEELKNHVYINKESLGSSTSPEYQFKYLDISSVTKGNINLPHEYIFFSDSPSRARRIIKKDDILFGTVRPYLQSHAYVDFDAKDIIVSTGFAVLTTKSTLYSRYLYQYLFSNEMQKQIDALLVGSNYPAINSSDVGNLKITVPPFYVQRKIAEILSTWDEVISVLNKKLNYLKTYRMGLMRSLVIKNFSEQKEQSNYIRLRYCLIPKNEIVSDRNIEPVAVGVNGIRLRSEIYDKELSSDYSKNKVIRENNLCFGIGTNNIVYDVLLENKTYCVSPAYKVFGINGIDPFYLKCYLDSFNKYFSKKYMIISARQGKSVDMEGLLSEKIYAPDLSKQKQFSKTIKVIDDYIYTQSREIDYLKKQKQGLMQQLLTGKIRVNIN